MIEVVLEENQGKVNETEISLCKIKEGDMSFVAEIFRFAQDYLDERYGEGNAKGFVRNSKDGCYELFAVVKDNFYDL